MAEKKTAEKATSRRKMLTAGAAGAAAAVVAAPPAAAQSKPERKVHWSGDKVPENPLFSPVVTYGNLVFVAGKGAHFEGDIKSHTDHVLNTIQKELERVGSSMDKCLKCNVYLHDLNDYAGMNEVFKGRFGPNPPVRTTIATYGGVPGDSLVEIDVIAFI
ncbi:MAG: RidA family protein [Acidobacteria bacterium]|nr:RidA family protein [Acidobacteriota bacterium]